jgi:hypothetical protein
MTAENYTSDELATVASAVMITGMAVAYGGCGDYFHGDSRLPL